MPELTTKTPSFDLFAGVLDRKGYIVGDANAGSGLHVLPAAAIASLGSGASQNESGAAADAHWRHHGWNNVRCFGLAVDDGTWDDQQESHPTLFMAGGNGVLRSRDLTNWRVTTDWRITEVLDVVIGDNRSSGQCPLLLAATVYGPVGSDDWGETWIPLRSGLESYTTSATFCTSLRISADGRIAVLGTEDGVFTSSWDGNRLVVNWIPVAERGLRVRCLTEDPFRPGRWFVATDGSGLCQIDLRQATGTSASISTLPAQEIIYVVACSEIAEGTIAAAGLSGVLWITSNGGDSHVSIPLPDSSTSVHAIAFDPVDHDVVWIGTTDAGVFRYQMSSRKWTFAGLTDASLRSLVFVPSHSSLSN